MPAQKNNTGHGPCPKRGCKGRLKVYDTVVMPDGRHRRRLLHCPTCKTLPEDNKRIVSLDWAPRRPRKRKALSS
jgi:hypothetical protein